MLVKGRSLSCSREFAALCSRSRMRPHTLLIEPFEIEVLISEHTRRTIQTKLGEPISFYTIFYIEGGAMVSRLVPRVVGFLSPIDREFFDIFCSVDGVGVRKALRAMVRPGP